MAHQRAFDLEVAHMVQARLAKQLSLVLDRYSHIIYFHHQDLSELSLKIEKLSISNIASIYRSCGVNIYIYVQGLRVGFSMSDYS